MKKLLIVIRTVFRLGLWNVAYVFLYRVALKTGIIRYKFPVKQLISTENFYGSYETTGAYPDEWKQYLLNDADHILSGFLKYYSFHWKKVGNPPDWFFNPFSGTHYPDNHLHWTKLTDFHQKAGDIKNIWEASRFEWLVKLARAYAVTGKIDYLDGINTRINDWVLKNPVNTGPNWKCGQEVAFRVFNLLIAAYILKNHLNPASVLSDLIYAHLERINNNIGYGLAQDNNHGISESAGLFVGGSWLMMLNDEKYLLSKSYSEKGRRILEKQVEKLIAPDGSFSQHSTNYHRVVLDTISYAEFWRITTRQEPFCEIFYSRVRAAIDWLFDITDSSNGNVPNFGANDGAMINQLHSCSYRDFRPSLQLSGALFFKNNLYENGKWDEPLKWLDLTEIFKKQDSLVKKNKILNTGYLFLHSSDALVFLRLPYFRFRPAHNDVFHFDLWHKGVNILCDAGTYSYNPPPDEEVNLKSVNHHNTVCFDGNEQMPQLSRFLLGNWLRVDHIGNIQEDSAGLTEWTGSYYDNNRNRHQRKITSGNNLWIIEDTLEGNFANAKIGFNINYQKVILAGREVFFPGGKLTFDAKVTATLTDSPVSEYYFEKHLVKRLIMEVDKPGIYKTVLSFN